MNPSPLQPTPKKEEDPIKGELYLRCVTTGIRTDEFYEHILAHSIHPIVRATIQELAKALLGVPRGVPILDHALRSLPMGVGAERFLSSCNAMMRTIAEYAAASAAVLAHIESFAEEIRSDMVAILPKTNASSLPPGAQTQMFVFGVGIPNPTSPVQPVPSSKAPPQRKYGPPPGRARSQQRTP